jgi:hypothetical protein
LNSLELWKDNILLSDNRVILLVEKSGKVKNGLGKVREIQKFQAKRVKAQAPGNEFQAAFSIFRLCY